MLIKIILFNAYMINKTGFFIFLKKLMGTLLWWLMSSSAELLPSSSRWQKMDLQAGGLHQVYCTQPKEAVPARKLKRVNSHHCKVSFSCRDIKRIVIL